MAKKSTTAAGTEPTGKEVRVPQPAAMKSFNIELDNYSGKVIDAKEVLDEAKVDAEKKHLYLPAFKVAKGLQAGVKEAKNESIAAEKLAKWLANFDHYRKFFKLDELANLQGRMFAEGPIGGDGDDEEPGREIQEDGESDDRPRHLRQPGASAAEGTSNPVADLAAKAGASLPPDEDNPLNQVGRGKPH